MEAFVMQFGYAILSVIVALTVLCFLWMLRIADEMKKTEEQRQEAIRKIIELHKYNQD